MRDHPALRPLHQLLLLLLTLLVGCGGELADPEVPSLTATAQATPGGPMVRMLYTEIVNYGCSSCLQARGYAELRNLHPTKQLTVVYSLDGGPFVESAARFVGLIDAEREIWSFEMPAPGRVRFALRYRAAGQEHWDNNADRNYEVEGNTSSPALGIGRDVALMWAQVESLEAGELDLYLLVRNRAFHKQVLGVYSADNWATKQTAQAYYVGSYGGFERWKVTAPFRKEAGQLSAAVVARQAGGEQWDNNYGNNFSCVRCQSRACQRWICQGLTLNP